MSPRLWQKSSDLPRKASPTWKTDPHVTENDDCDLYSKAYGGSWEISSTYDNGIFYCAHCQQKEHNKLRMIWNAYSMSRNGDWGEEFEIVCLECNKYSLFSDSG